MDENRELKITVKMMITQAQEALKHMDAALDKTGKTGKTFGGMMKTIGAGVVGFGKGVIGLVTSLKSLVAALLAVQAVRKVVSVFTGLAEELDRTSKLSRELGFDIEKLSGLLSAGKFSGAAPEQLTQALRKLNVVVGQAREGQAEYNQAFNDLGVSIRGSGIEEILFNVSDALKNTANESERARLAAKLFGEEAGPRLLSMLSEGSSGLRSYIEEARRLGVVLTESQARAVEDMRNSWIRLGMALKGGLSQLVADIAPALTAIADVATEVVLKVKKAATNLFDYITGGMKVGELIQAFVTGIRLLGGALVSALEDIGKGEFPRVLKDVWGIARTYIDQGAIYLRLAIRRAFLGAIDGIIEQAPGLGKLFGIDSTNNELTQVTEDAELLALELERLGYVIDLIDKATENMPAGFKATGAAVDSTTGKVSRFSLAMEKLKTIAIGVGQGVAAAWKEIKRNVADVSGQIQTQFVGAFNSMQSSAAGFFETIYKGGKAKDAFKEFVASMVSSLISLAAQLTVVIGLALLFNVFTGGGLATTGLAATASAIGGAGSLFGLLSGASSSGGGNTGAGEQTLANTGGKSAGFSRTVPQFNVQPAGGTTNTYIEIKALDSKSFLQLLNRPENASGVTKLVTYRQRSSIHGGR